MKKQKGIIAMRYLLIAVVFISLTYTSASAATQGKHLFILSGQSNMAKMNHSKDFSPIVEKKFAKKNVIVVKVAKSGQPIRRWHKEWKKPEGRLVRVSTRGEAGDIYK